MTVSFASYLTAWSTFAAAVAAALGLAFTGWQLLRANRSSDLQNLTMLRHEMLGAEIEHTEAHAAGDPRRIAISDNHILNLCEMLAVGFRKGMLRSASRTFAAEYVVEMIALQEHYGNLQYTAGVAYGLEFEHLGWFSKKHRNQIDRRKLNYAEQDNKGAPSAWSPETIRSAASQPHL